MSITQKSVIVSDIPRKARRSPTLINILVLNWEMSYFILYMVVAPKAPNQTAFRNLGIAIGTQEAEVIRMTEWYRWHRKYRACHGDIRSPPRPFSVKYLTDCHTLQSVAQANYC